MFRAERLKRLHCGMRLAFGYIRSAACDERAGEVESGARRFEGSAALLEKFDGLLKAIRGATSIAALAQNDPLSVHDRRGERHCTECGRDAL